MLPGVIKNLNREFLLIATESNFIYSPLNYQIVRWRRKPRWLPVAKSKMFRVPERPKVPEEEKVELQRLVNNYKTEMKSLRSYFAAKNKESFTGDEVIAEQKKIEEEEHKKCLLLNDEWNTTVASLRTARHAKEKELEFERIMKQVEESKIKEQEMKEKLELLVREEKERSKYYITPNNIDEAIEKALSDTVDYDYAIDLEGNKYVGRLTKPKLAGKSKGPEVSL